MASGMALAGFKLSKLRALSPSEGLPPDADTCAVREYLAVLDDAPFRAATPVVPKF